MGTKSREIKFRAWDEEGKKIVFNFCEENKNQIIALMVSDTKLELMQYTGLKDKNGVEIYEGDIVTYYYYSDEEPERFTVIFDIPMFAFNSHLDKKNWNIREHDEIRIEVIGNIYENPELLK